jgi:hypothetical protein
MAASRPYKQRECRVRRCGCSWCTRTTLHFSTYLPTLNFALSTFTWRTICADVD